MQKHIAKRTLSDALRARRYGWHEIAYELLDEVAAAVSKPWSPAPQPKSFTPKRRHKKGRR